MLTKAFSSTRDKVAFSCLARTCHTSYVKYVSMHNQKQPKKSILGSFAQLMHRQLHEAGSFFAVLIVSRCTKVRLAVRGNAVKTVKPV